MSETESQPARQAGRRSRLAPEARWDVVLLAGLLALGVALPLLAGLAAGSQDIARNDDWVYRRTALDLASRGVLSLHSVTTMMVGQIIMVQPFETIFGLNPTAFSAFGAVSAGGAVLAAYWLARQFLGPWRAALATALLVVFPGYLAYATSFMTDVPTLALELTCVCLGVMAVRRRPVRTQWLLASAAVGCLGFSIREFAIAAPVAVLLAAICADPRRARTWAVGLGVVAFVVLLEVLKSTLPGQHLGNPNGYISTGIDLSQAVEALGSVGLALLPALLIAAVRWRGAWNRAGVVIGAELGILVVVYQLFEWHQTGALPFVLLPLSASTQGAAGPGIVVGTRPLLMGDPAWLVLSAVALAAAVLGLVVGAGIVGSVVRRYKHSMGALIKAMGSPAGVLVLFTGLVGLGVMAFGVHWAIYDRYYWPLIPPAAILLMWLPTDRAPQASLPRPISGRKLSASLGAILAGLALVALIFMGNAFAFDAARWRAGEQLVQLGVAPDQLDAGYEWVGAHAPALPESVQAGPGLTFYENFFIGYRACGVASASPWAGPGYELVGTQGYLLNLVAGPIEDLYLYRSTGPDCTPK